MIYGSKVPRPGHSKLPDWPTFSLPLPHTDPAMAQGACSTWDNIFCISMDTDLFMKKCNYGKFQLILKRKMKSLAKNV